MPVIYCVCVCLWIGIFVATVLLIPFIELDSVHFLGVGQKLGILRYKVDFQSLQADELLDDVDLDDY